MNRSQKFVIVCHCILNANAKVYPLASVPGVFLAKVAPLIDAGYGIFQLPCPELSYLGMNRWGMTREQYDHPNFRNHCKEILKYPLIQIQSLVSAGYKLTGIIGMDGSPNCGVHFTCEGYKGGDFCLETQIHDQIKSLKFTSGKGVFMEELLTLLGYMGIQPELLAVEEIQSQSLD